TRIQGKEPPEPAHLAHHTGAARGLEDLGQSGFDTIAQVDIHSGAGVSFSRHFQRLDSSRKKPPLSIAGRRMRWFSPGHASREASFPPGLAPLRTDHRKPLRAGRKSSLPV